MKKIKIISQKGITMVSLIVTIVVLLILSTIIITDTYTGTDYKKYKLMCADVELLEDKIALYYNKYGELPTTHETVSIEGIETFQIDTAKLSNLTLSYDLNDFLIDTTTWKVYYKKGIEYKGIIYYTNEKILKKWYYCIEDGTKSETPTNYVTNGSVNDEKEIIVIPIGSVIGYEAKVDGQSFTHTPTLDGIYTSVDGSTYLQEELSTIDLGGWVLLGVSEEGCLELVSVNPTNGSSLEVKYGFGLRGRDAYSNNVEALNTACDDLYGKGIGAKKARSINEQDIEKISTYDKTTYSLGSFKYGDKIGIKMMKPEGKTSYYFFFNGPYYSESSIYTVTDDDGITWYSTGGNKYPYYYETEWVQLGKDEEITVTYNYYQYSLSPTYVSDKNLLNILQKGDDNTYDAYWIAYNCVTLDDQYIHFYVGRCHSGQILPAKVYQSSNLSLGAIGPGLRPVVVLKPEVELSKNNDGSYDISLGN